MKKHLTLLVLAVSGFTIMLSFFATSLAFAQDTPYDEEYMAQHDGGDRDEYLQEMEHSDPKFYVPPVDDTSITPATNSLTTVDN